MAISVRRLNDSPIQLALVIAHNKLLVGTSIVGANIHADVLSTTTGDALFPATVALTVSAPVAADLPTSLVLANNIQAVGLAMLKDAASTDAYFCGSHKVPDTIDAVVAPTAVDLPTAIALANAWKAQFNVHCVSTAYHYTADTVIATANATILSDLIVLLNAMQTKFNSHIAAAPAGAQMVKIINA